MSETKEYRYYSTQRPVDIGTYPKPPDNLPLAIENYDGRIYVERGAYQAWGHLTYAVPLTERQMSDYELRPSRENTDLKQRMYEQGEVVGKFEARMQVPDQERLTWWNGDFGAFVVKDFVTPRELARRFEIAQAQYERAKEKKGKATAPRTKPGHEGR